MSMIVGGPPSGDLSSAAWPAGETVKLARRLGLIGDGESTAQAQERLGALVDLVKQSIAEDLTANRGPIARELRRLASRASSSGAFP